jgi:hypothetical protein
MSVISLLENQNSDVKGKPYPDIHCVLCESCFWSATSMLPDAASILQFINVCPICNNKSLSLIPLTMKESYKIMIGPRGLEMEFCIRDTPV